MALRINLRKIRPGYILKPRGKNLKFVYYVRCGLRHFVPSFWLRRHKAELLATLDARTDKEQILDRVNYYNKLTGIRELSGLTHVSDVTNSNGTYGSSSKPPSLNDGGADLFKRVTFDQVLKSVESSRER